MKRKTTLIGLILVFGLTLSNTTCDFLNKDMRLILPPYLYDADTTMNKGNAVIQIYDTEETVTIVELEIIPANADDPDNYNNDNDDLSKIISIPPYAKISENELSAEFECKAIDTEMEAPYYKDVSIRASALHYNEAIDTMTIYDVTPEPTDVPTTEPTSKTRVMETPEPAPQYTPAPTVMPEHRVK